MMENEQLSPEQKAPTPDDAPLASNKLVIKVEEIQPQANCLLFVLPLELLLHTLSFLEDRSLVRMESVCRFFAAVHPRLDGFTCSEFVARLKCHQLNKILVGSWKKTLLRPPKLFYCDRASGVIAEMDTDGSNFRVILDQLTAPKGVFVSLHWQKIFFTEQNNIGCSNLDGSNRRVLLSSLGGEYLGGPNTVRIADDYLYWGNTSQRNMCRGKLVLSDDGEVLLQEVTVLVPDRKVHGFFVDHPNQRVFWLDWSLDVIERLDLKTLETTRLLKIPGSYGLTANIRANHLYWAAGDRSVLFRGDLQAQGAHHVASSANVRAVELDLTRNLMYFSGWAGIFVANLDGSNPTQICSANAIVKEPVDLCLVD